MYLKERICGIFVVLLLCLGTAAQQISVFGVDDLGDVRAHQHRFHKEKP